MLRPSVDIKTVIEAIQRMKVQFPRIGLVVMGSNTICEDMDSREVHRWVEVCGLESCNLWTGDLRHDEFLTVLSKSSVFVRTHIYDGVCSSVLEGLALKIRVVACENPHRPAGVIRFQSGDADDLAENLMNVCKIADTFHPEIKRQNIKDTVAEEVNLLLGAAL